MRIMGCDLHARQQTLAMLETLRRYLVTEGRGHSEPRVFVKKAQKSRGSLWPVLPQSRGSPVWPVLPALGVPTQADTPPLRLLLGSCSQSPYAHR